MSNGDARGRAQGVHEEAKTIKALKKMSDLDVEKMILIAEMLGKHLVNVGLKTAQIRRFSDAVKRIESRVKINPDSFNRSDLLLLKPRLAYATGRKQNKKQLEPFQMVIDPAIDKVTDIEDFFRFSQFMESIIAYHRFHGGEDY